MHWLDASVVGTHTPVLAVVAVVAALAAVQSVFGVGLLVFGTPLLLLAGLPFPLVLAYLLPCSIVISALQLAGSGGLRLDGLRWTFLRFTAPAVVVGTLVVLWVGTRVEFRPVVGVVLLATATMRLIRPLATRVERFAAAHVPALALGVGTVHGLTNLGGGLLTALVGSLSADKAEVRRQVAFCYGLMAAIQLTVLFATARPEVSPVLWLALPALAAAIYAAVGQRLFRIAGRATYQVGLTGMIGAFGMLLVAT